MPQTHERPHLALQTGSNVAVLRWPEHDERRRLLTALGRPRLLLLASGTAAPDPVDDLEVSMPESTRPAVVAAAMDALETYARQSVEEPVLDDEGLLWFKGRWVAIPDIQLPIVELLVRNRDRVVHHDDISRTYRDTGGSDSPSALRSLLRRVAQRLSQVGLVLHAVHRRGVILAAQAPSERGWPASTDQPTT